MKCSPKARTKVWGAFGLEAARPELPDFDLGAIEDASGLSSADVDLLADDNDAKLDEISLDDDEIGLDLNEDGD